MQHLVIELAKTFIGDAAALVNGFGRTVTHIVTAPIERLANACDVGGILRERAARAAERERLRDTWRALSRTASKPDVARRRSRRWGCLNFLGELT